MYGVSQYGMSRFGLNSFEQVEACYNNTKPIISKNQTLQHDIRPIGDRGRKWERIAKVSDTCYMLLNGELGDNATWYYKCEEGTENYIIQDVSATLTFAPVVWTRHDGYDTIRIRNGSGHYAHNSRYSFIARCLPNSMSAIIGDGKQYIVHDNVRYLLPKSMWFPNNHYNAQNGLKKDDEHYLVFRRDHGDSHKVLGEPIHRFKLTGNKFTWHAKRYGVDVATKNKYKSQINELWDYMCTVAPMFNNIFGGRSREMGQGDFYQEQWETRQHKYKARREALNEGREEVQNYVENVLNIPQERVHYMRDSQIYQDSPWKHAHFPVPLIEQILADDQHPMRLNLVRDIINDMEDIVDCQDKQEASKIRSQYNRWFNKHMGFTKLVADEHITKEEV